MKSKPTQNAIRQLYSYGVNPDIIIARSEVPMDQKRKEKIAISCSLPVEQVISAPDIESVFDVPLNFEKDNISKIILQLLHLRKKKNETGMGPWEKFANVVKNTKETIDIAIVGKYFNTGDFVLTDAYVSVLEAIKYSSYKLGKKAVIHTVNAREYEGENKHKADFKALEKYDGIIVPGGFGESGIEGKLAVIQYAREHKIPYFGLCYGMQLMVIEYARNILGLKDANTTEINPNTKNPIIDIMEDQKKLLEQCNYGGSMRLGAYDANLEKGTIAYEAYGQDVIQERHRHRYEVNPEYIEQLTDAGLVFSGKSPSGVLMEIAELPKKDHPFFLGTQFHPEFLARPLAPHPLFTSFIKAAITRKSK
jgi:CTP synthase